MNNAIDDNKSTPQQEILSLLIRWQEGVSAGNVDKICSLYAHDAALWGTFTTKQRITNPAIRTYFEELLTHQACSVHIIENYLRYFDNTAVCSGLYTFLLKDGDNEKSVAARFSITLHCRNGEWLIVEHHSSKC
ncbi:nuclear transport factor 2 family protein [Litorilituus lipolyticus]|uniref:DUF4440 domain-containing protein n=1 Tax=Litorilituus lipolyticus TaxID=2491017 RepID=A0A502KY29_9GAMM|nr:nuclear transport factor 2 family protein [Litorilituus lipolyticus]TPH15065.1 DUF4440 domain-containing protein [Litorilituus lipolyticus]